MLPEFFQAFQVFGFSVQSQSKVKILLQKVYDQELFNT